MDVNRRKKYPYTTLIHSIQLHFNFHVNKFQARPPKALNNSLAPQVPEPGAQELAWLDEPIWGKCDNSTIRWKTK